MDILVNYYSNAEIKSVVESIASLYAPTKIVLFGSQAKGSANDKSDIDLCIIKDTNNKRSLLTDMYLNIDCNKPFDLVLYTPSEWERCVADSTSFAYLINEKGKVLYG